MPVKGHFDGTLSAWDSECVERAVWQLKAHETVANAVSAHPKEPLAVTGGREGTVKVWDLRTKQSVRKKNEKWPTKRSRGTRKAKHTDRNKDWRT